MGLLNLKTDLKSLKYGRDRLGGGNSNQPYITSKIPENNSDLGNKGGPDFLLRGGSLTLGRIAKDTSRLTKMFFDFRSPNGILFTAKQNVLSRTSIATNGEGKALNNGIYLPTSTILGAAGNPIGLHLNKQGIDPTKGIGKSGNFLSDLLNFKDPLSQPYYQELVTREGKSRLEKYFNTHISKVSQGNLYEYNGGPGAILGIGKTKIPLLQPIDRTGINNPKLNYTQKPLTFKTSTETFLSGDEITTINYTPSTYKNLKPQYDSDKQRRVDDAKYKWGATSRYFSTINDPSQNNILNGALGFNNNSLIPNSVYKPGTLDSSNLIDRGNTLTQQQLVESQTSKLNPTIQPNVLNLKGYSKLNYVTDNIEQRVNLGNPGKKLKDSSIPLDKINFKSLYKSEAVTTDISKNDLVKFRIGVIDNDNPNQKTFIHFRAFIDGFNDSYSADWQTQKFMGRGENFYRYNGFDRNISLSWTVAAQSKQELIPMYHKLNYLASVCAPDYSKLGYMRGNLITLTIGGYLYEQVGILKNITYDIPQESPWEIAIPYGNSNQTDNGGIQSDPDVKELPHIIKVTGFQFIPIHDFVPSVQKNIYDKNGIKYGKERYIALNNGYNNNYDN